MADFERVPSPRKKWDRVSVVIIMFLLEWRFRPSRKFIAFCFCFHHTWKGHTRKETKKIARELKFLVPFDLLCLVLFVWFFFVFFFFFWLLDLLLLACLLLSFFFSKKNKRNLRRLLTNKQDWRFFSYTPLHDNQDTPWWPQWSYYS